MREAEARRDAALKFNGAIVRQLTGLEGRELGAFIKRFREAHDVTGMAAEEIVRCVVAAHCADMRGS